MENTTLTREQLYELVWNTPMIQLSKKYKISDNGLRKICKRMNIPTPSGAYWTKLKYNINVIKERLPKNYSGKNEVNLSERDDEESCSNSIVSQRSRLAKSYKELDQSYFQVQEKLTKPNRMIKEAKSILSKSKVSRWSRDQCIYTTGDALNIKVSPHNVSRALNFYNALINLLHYRKHDLIIENNRTYAVIKDIKVELYLREKLRIEKVNEGTWTTSKYFPTGRLILRIDCFIDTREIEDGSEKLEERLADILADLELRAEKEKERRIESEKRRKIQEEKDRIERELREKKEKEISDFNHLLSMFDRWQQARNLREYIKAVKEKNENEGTHKNELKEWAQWANNKADWYDPLVNKEDDLLGFFKPKYQKD